MVNSSGLPMFTGSHLRPGQAQDAVNLVADVAEAARLFAVAIDGKWVAAKRLLHEVRDHAAVVELQTRAVSIEDAQNARIHFVVTAVGHGRGFGKALGLVIDRAR